MEAHIIEQREALQSLPGPRESGQFSPDRGSTPGGTNGVLVHGPEYLSKLLC